MKALIVLTALGLTGCASTLGLDEPGLTAQQEKVVAENTALYKQRLTAANAYCTSEEKESGMDKIKYSTPNLYNDWWDACINAHGGYIK